MIVYRMMHAPRVLCKSIELDDRVELRMSFTDVVDYRVTAWWVSFDEDHTDHGGLNVGYTLRYHNPTFFLSPELIHMYLYPSLSYGSSLQSAHVEY